MSRPTYAEEAKSLLRTRILAAVHELLAERRWKAVSMSAVADAAGVSRQTVYNEFDGRDRLAMAYVLWQADVVLDGVADAMLEHGDDLVTALRVALDVFVDTTTTHPMLRAVATGEEDDGLLVLVSAPSGSPVVEFSIDRVVSTIEHGWPHVDQDAIRPVVAMIVRLALSQVAMPTASSPLTPDTISQVLAPYLESLSPDQPPDGG